MESIEGTTLSRHSKNDDIEGRAVADEAFGEDEDLYPDLSDVTSPTGTDPVYERKARVLNDAVLPTRRFLFTRDASLTFARSRKLVWDGINGNCSLWLVLVGRTIICGLSSPL